MENILASSGKPLGKFLPWEKNGVMGVGQGGGGRDKDLKHSSELEDPPYPTPSK